MLLSLTRYVISGRTGMSARKRKKRSHGSPAGGAVSSWGRTDVGRKREKKEDSFLVDSSLMLYVVADGMGGHAGGGTASRMAVKTVHSTVQEARQGGVFPSEAGEIEHPAITELLGKSISKASGRIHEASARNPDLHGMGTTVTTILFHGPRCYVGHVGDSRLYRLRDGVFEQLTEDHSLVAEQVKAGFITAEEAQLSRFRNIITRSVGFESQVEADTFSADVRPGDVCLMCSDGLTGMVSDDEIEHVMKHSRLRDAADLLVAMANRAGGEDNITVVLLRNKGHLGRSAARKHRSAAKRRRRTRGANKGKTGR